jgi:hypothetical protein
VYKTLYSVCGEFLLISLKVSIIKKYILLVQIIQPVMEKVCIIHCTYNILNREVKGYGVYHNFQQYFNYTVAVSFIGEGNQSTQRKPLTNFNHIMLCCVQLAMSGIRTHNFSDDEPDCKGSCKSNYHTIVTTSPTILNINVYYTQLNTVFIMINKRLT